MTASVNTLIARADRLFFRGSERSTDRSPVPLRLGPKGHRLSAKAFVALSATVVVATTLTALVAFNQNVEAPDRNDLQQHAALVSFDVARSIFPSNVAQSPSTGEARFVFETIGSSPRPQVISSVSSRTDPLPKS